MKYFHTIQNYASPFNILGGGTEFDLPTSYTVVHCLQYGKMYLVQNAWRTEVGKGLS